MNYTIEITAKEKARAIYDESFRECKREGFTPSPEDIKVVSLMAANMIWELIEKNFEVDPEAPALSEMKKNRLREYWEEVKKEIELIN